jgi:vitamin B12 transporter
MKKNFFVAAGLGLVQLALLSAAARAQDTSRVLNDVVVTANRSPVKLSAVGRDVEVITSAQIAKSQGETLPQLLNTIPGITFSGANNAPGISSSIYVRGASTGNVLILVDGFPVNNPSATDNSYDLNAFPLDQIDHIEFLKGSASTLYGSDAVAGVINIITKHPKNQGLKTNLQLNGGSFATFNEALGVNGRINNTGIALNVSNTDSKGFPAATDTTGKGGFRNDDFHQRSVSLNVNQQVSKRFTLNGNFQTSYNTGHLPQGSFTDDENYTYANTFLFAGLGGKLLLDKGTLNVNISENDVLNHYNDLAGPTNYETTFYEKNTGHITDAQVIFNYALFKNIDITSGADFKHSSTYQMSTYDTLRGSSSIGSIFSQLSFKSRIFQLDLGGRYNHDSKYGNNFTYTINPVFFIGDALKIFGTLASAYKAPALYQQISQYGNPDLSPETTTSYEAGFTWQIIKDALLFKTSVFKYNTKNVIYFKELASPPYGVYENGEMQKNKGFESSLKLNLDKITASAYVAYVDGALTDENGVTNNNIYRVPKTTLGGTIDYRVTTQFSIGLVDKFTGNRTDEDFNTPMVSTVNLGHYNLLDAHLQYAVSKQLTLTGNLKNLFNVKYTDWYGYNTSRFNFMAGLRYQIN